MYWQNFPLFAIISIILWAIGLTLHYKGETTKSKTQLANSIVIAGLCVLAFFIANLWIHLERPPMRTLGETRLWYGFFLPLVGLITYTRWGYKWFLAYSLALATLFLGIDLAKPELFEKTLMPALQSPWFVPHVIVYIFAYALLAASSLVGLKGLYEFHFQKKTDQSENLKLGDNLVYIGFSFLTLGLIFGALWAKEAWGHYWTWDPKETWAFLTWIGYLIYMHYRHNKPQSVKGPLWTLSLAFVVLLICWFGLNYLPSAQNSVHVYARE